MPLLWHGLRRAESVRGKSRARCEWSEHTRRVRREFVPYEAAWAYANVAAEGGPGIKERADGSPRPRLRHDFRGLRGTDRALAFWHQTKDDERVDARKGYRLLQAQEAQGGLGSYLVALRHYGFVHPDRLELTTAGAELAGAFLAGTRRAKEALEEDGPRDRRVWQRAGEQLSLAHPTHEERSMIAKALFRPSSSLGRFVSLLPSDLRKPERAREAFEFIAARNDELASTALYALRFDAVRRSCLALFGRLGQALGSEPVPRRLGDLLAEDDLTVLADAVTVAAKDLSPLAPPDGLRSATSFAVELADAHDTPAVVRLLVDFHRREGRRWIEPAGPDRYALGVAANFRAPGEGFHGFTLPAALSVYADVTPEDA